MVQRPLGRLSLILLGLAVLSAAGGYEVPQRIARECVGAHNRYRISVGSPPLRWNPALADRAEQWAQTLIERGEFRPRRDGVFGENLYEVSGGSATPAEVVAAWMTEERNYHPRTGTCSGRCGHFTQVVWSATERVGCGAARDARREVWVCNYDPPGNLQGERPFPLK